MVIKDLIKGDGCIEELEQTYIMIGKLEERDTQKNKKIEILEKKDSTNQFIIQQQLLQIGEYKSMTSSLQEELKTSNNKTKWWRTGAIGSTAALILLLILK